MGDTSIEWCDKTWNPVRGCSRVSPGCGGAAGEGGCYAERQAARFAGPGGAYEGLIRIGKQGPRWTGQVRLVREHLEDPLKWKTPRRIFVNSMSDLFHESLTDYDIANVFGVMEACRSRGHTFQVLTKRAERMHDWVNEWARKINYADDRPGGYTRRYGHVWLGVSVEDRRRAEERMYHLCETQAVTRFVSYEPALEHVDFTRWLDTGKVSWLICGAESGPGARPFDVAWARSVRDQCTVHGAAFFFKQDAIKGRKIPTPELDGKRWVEFPEVAHV